MIKIKKYILLIIGLLMMASNALAQSAFDNEGHLIQPADLTVKEAYILSKKKTVDLKNSFNQSSFVSFEGGVIMGVTASRIFGFKDQEKRWECVARPIAVFENIIFGQYEKGEPIGKIPYGLMLAKLITEQCFKK